MSPPSLLPPSSLPPPFLPPSLPPPTLLLTTPPFSLPPSLPPPTSPQSLGVSGESGEEVILSPARSGGVWLQAGHSHWLLGLQGEVTIETELDHALLLEEWLEGEAVEVRVHYGGEGGRLLEIECRGEGKGGVVEISSLVKLEEFRGKPLLVSE